MLEFVSTLFDGLTILFASTPVLYLFGILVLAFIILAVKMIVRL